MIHFILGRSGSGKSTHIYKAAAESLSAGVRTFLLVPEQQAVDAEQRMTDLIGDKPSLGLEILNFKRLCNRIFREYGGLSYNYITQSGRALLMWQAVSELSGQLVEYGAGFKNDASLVSTLLSAVSEFKTYRITPAALERSMKELISDNEQLNRNDESNSSTEPNRLIEPVKKLAAKLSDLSLIYANYVALVSESRDDASDDLDKAAELLASHDFFAGADVYLDSFNGFTPQEFAIIYQLMRQSANLTISLCLDPSGCEPFVNVAGTYERLKRIAGSLHKPFDETSLNENRRTAYPELRYLEAQLWSLAHGDSGFTGSVDSEHLSLVECPDLFAECESVAVDILRRVRTGAEWNDFAIIMRGCKRYDGIIDVTLEKYSIPFFFSKRTDLTSKPLIKLIFAAFTIRAGGFRASDVISYIKTGLTGIEPDETAELECYAELWSIRGQSRWSKQWELSPRGFNISDANSDDDADKHRLEVINSARERLISPLTNFFTQLDDCKTVLEYSKALYEFLLSLSIPSQLETRIDTLRQESTSASLAEADELGQLWSIIIDALDELAATVPQLEVDCDGFTKLLGLVFSETDIGRIPATVDEVVVGDASLLRAAKRHIYVIGANEGIFPKSPSSNGIFTDLDRELLAVHKIELAGNCEYRSADERFTFYRALSSASESLTLSWSTADLSGKALRPSLGALRLTVLFPGIKIKKYTDCTLVDRLEGSNNLLEFAAESAGTPLGAALYEYCRGIPELRDKLKMLDLALTESDIQLEAETSRLISGGDLALTQSRLDSYVLCHFSYFCKYILKLEKTKPAKFDAGDIGTFVHHILELFVSEAERSGQLCDISDAEIERIVDDIVGEYIEDVSRIAPEADGSRLGHLFAKLRRSSKLLCRSIADEFGQSEFKPTYYELPIRFADPGDGAATVAPLEVKLDDNTSAYIYGIADRVDTLKRGNRLYVRVIDYKTGAKEFSLDDIAMGLNLQMLLYLFSLWKNGSDPSSALARLSHDAEIIPAGVLYFTANVPTITLDSAATPEEVTSEVCKKLSRRGLLLDDSDVLSAMERELSGRYLPVKIKKDGSFTGADALKSLQDFGVLLNDIEATIRRIGGEIKRGSATAHPLRTKKHDACKDCEMKPICRKCR